MTDTVRRFVLAILLIGMIGSLVELVLLEHDEDLNQWIPLVLLSTGILGFVFATVRPGSQVIRFLQILMAFFIVAGAVGVVLHFQANLEFQTELDPSASGLPLWMKAIRAKAPPALAPGVMVQLGLLGLVYTFRHPALAGRSALTKDVEAGLPPSLKASADHRSLGEGG
jgi:hypothetical protein